MRNEPRAGTRAGKTSPAPTAPAIHLRIPGPWECERELEQALPDGYEILGGHTFTNVDCVKYPFEAGGADIALPARFVRACGVSLSRDGQRALEEHRMVAHLSGPGGSAECALDLFWAARVFLEAGGVGIYVENSEIAHEAAEWMKWTSIADVSALLHLVVGIEVVEDPPGMWSVGMGVVGQPDVVVASSGNEVADETAVVKFVTMLCMMDGPMEEGAIFGDLEQSFQVTSAGAEPGPSSLPREIRENPYGRWRLVRIDERA